MCCVCLFRDEFKIWNFFRDFRREANGRMEAYTYGWRHTPVYASILLTKHLFFKL
jgi:hypothetical protein